MSQAIMVKKHILLVYLSGHELMWIVFFVSSKLRADQSQLRKKILCKRVKETKKKLDLKISTNYTWQG